MEQEAFLTVAEIAAELRVHPVTVQKLCRDGALQSYRVGRSYRIPKSSFDDYRRGAIAQAKADEDSPPTLEPELSALVTAWLHDMEHGPKPCSLETVRTHRRHMHRYVQALHGDDPNARVTYRKAASEAALIRVMTSIPVAKFATRYNLFMAVLSFSRFLVGQGLLDEAERARMKRHKPKRLTPPKRTVLSSMDEVNRFFEALWQSEAHTTYEKTLNAAALGTMVFAGLRASEVANLEVGHVDLPNRLLHVHAGKGGKSRIVGLNPRLQESIEAYLKIRPETTAPVLFLSDRGRPLDRDRLNKRVRRIANRAGLDVSCHGLRRAFGTINANAGKSLNLIQLALGHSSLTTTQAYLMADQRTAAQAMQGW
ncbi:Tyrosine recombinase XerD [compost metagenome]